MVAAAVEAKAEILPNGRLRGADDDTAYLQHTLTERQVLVEGVGAVVLAQGHASVADLLEVDGFPRERIHAVGDCLSPRTVEEAVLEGLTVVSAI
ncbi:hypothetical protein [Rhodococcus koreensis]